MIIIIINANSTVFLNFVQIIQLVSKEEIIIKRDSTLMNSPLFKIHKGIFILGEENMKEKIV